MNNENGFRARLTARQEKVNSILCTGLDPLLDKLPNIIRRAYRMSPDKAIAKWMCEVVDASVDATSMFKPQRASYEAFPDGRNILQTIIGHIRFHDLSLPEYRGDVYS